MKHSDDNDRYVVVCCGEVKNWDKWEQSYMKMINKAEMCIHIKLQWD